MSILIKDILKYLIVILCVVNSGSLFYTTWDNNYFLFSHLGLALIYFFLFCQHKSSPKSLVFFVILLASYYLINLFISNFSIAYIGLFLKILTMFIIISTFREAFFYYLNNVIFYLCLFNLIIYFDYLGPKIFTILLNFLPNLSTTESNEYLNLIFFNPFITSEYGDVKFDMRNNGIFWEPGAYQFVLNFALLFELNKFRRKNYIIFFIISIITTFSTTGFLLLILNLLTSSYRTSLYSYLLSFSVISGVLIFMTVSDLGFKKVNELVSFNAEDEVQQGSASRAFDAYTDILIFLDSPIYGNGLVINEDQASIYKGERTGSSNSITYYLASFGIIGFLIFFYPIFFRKPKFRSRIFNVSFVIISLSSQNFILFPIFLGYLFYKSY
jgi:hypothetical protein